MEVYAEDVSLRRGVMEPVASVYSSSVLLALMCAGYWWKRPAVEDGTLVKLTHLCDWLLVPLYDWLCCKVSKGKQTLFGFLNTFHGCASLFELTNLCEWHCSEAEIIPLAGNLKAVHGSSEVIQPELSRQHSRAEQLIAVPQSNQKVPNSRVTSHSRGDTLPSSDTSEHSPKFYTSPPTSPGNRIYNRMNSQTPKVNEDHTGRKQRNTNSSGSSTVRASSFDSGSLDSGETHMSLHRQQSYNSAHEPNTEVEITANQCEVQGQNETCGSLKSEQFVSQTGSNVVSDTQNGTASGVPPGLKVGPSRLGHTDTSGVGSFTSESRASTCTLQSRASYNARPNRKGAPPNEQAGGHEVQPGLEGAVRRTSREVNHPVQESGLPHSSDIVVTVPVVPRRIGLVLGSDCMSWKHKLTSDSGNSKVSSSPKSPRATEGASTTNPTVTAMGQTGPHKWTKPSKAGDQTGCIVYSSIAAFEEGTFLPLPSREAVERSIGKGGNGTISVVYFKGLEFAVKRTHYCQMEVEILSSLCHDNVLSLQAVMMGEEDPQRPSRHFCYHFMPRMSGDLQGYLTKVGHGALSNLLMQHREDPTMLQLVVDNTKHILRSTLKALAYLHSINIVHNDVKPSNFLTNTQCGCQSPLLCNHGQRFAVKLSDYDSALNVTKVQTRHSVLRQLYRNNPIGTPGYRPPEYVLVATRTPDELDAATLTAADVWGFGCSVLKIFLSHSGPHTQKQMSFLHLWHKGGYPWEREGDRAREELKLALLERVYPNWAQLWSFVAECLKVSPKDRMTCSKLIEHPFFVS